MTKNFQLICWGEALIHLEDIKRYLTHLSGLNYILICKHLGKDVHDDITKGDHVHIYTQYQDDKKLSIKKLFTAHIVKCRGSPQQNISYLKCQDEKHLALGTQHEVLYEEGTPRLTGNIPNMTELMEIDDPKDLPDSRLYKIWKEVKTDQSADMDIDEWGKDVKVFYIQGPSGIGKTNKAKEIIKQHKQHFIDKYDNGKFNRIKYENGFYHGVGKAKMCIFDDFRSSDMRPKEFIQFIDYNRNLMNVKGGTKINEYELIIITSVERLTNIYKNVTGEPREQWMRRISLIDMYDNQEDQEMIDVINTKDNIVNKNGVTYYKKDGELYPYFEFVNK